MSTVDADDLSQPLLETPALPRHDAQLGDSLDRDGRGWLGGDSGRGRRGALQSSLSPSDLPGHHAPGLVYPDDAMQMHKQMMMRRAASAAALREARARRTAWIVIDSDAKRSFMQADKRSITHQLGLNIPIRDLRLMDFNLLTSDTGSILVRDNAIMFTIEHVRLIITADKVLVPREGYEHNPLANRFVDVLEEAIADWARQQQRAAEQLARVREDQLSDFEEESAGRMQQAEMLAMPFELVALEAALKEVVNASAMQVKELEGVALPALDALTKSVSTANLERVRKVKTRHQRLVIRVETLRDELQRFLHDDDDMIKMCLSRKKELEELYRQAAEAAAAEAAAAGADRAASVAVEVGSMSRRSPLTALMMQQQRMAAAAASPLVGTPGGAAGWDASGAGAQLQPLLQAGPTDEEYEEESEDVENLLESYFAQVDGLWDKLVSIGEYIKDTEEYINIELDSNRNRLIRLDIILTTATFAITPFNLIAGILGENLIIPSFLTQSVSGFWVLNGVSLLFVLTLFNLIILYMRWRKLI